ncbi:Uncharacterized protein FWK35_00031710 [Aphis craccivora]|uniref:Uncharacterized protein n=1 Tax=Aphis craccivora TaxID=307492 RepID=A0A6G0VKK2_APHCR|nr:Uncharacterized protein FWK35_00031710 [Aphis craccivora]
MRYAKANHKKTPDYDQANPKSWLIYQDWFKWVEPTLDGLNNLTNTSPLGRIYEVDIFYPQELHDKHNDLPFLPQNGIPTGSEVKKLMETLEPKKNYIVTTVIYSKPLKTALK